jgi:hypothetical protein
MAAETPQMPINVATGIAAPLFTAPIRRLTAASMNCTTPIRADALPAFAVRRQGHCVHVGKKTADRSDVNERKAATP